MAVQLEPGAYFNRSAAPPSFPLTMMCWARVSQWIPDNGFAWAAIMYLGATTFTDWTSLYYDNVGIRNIYVDDHFSNLAETTLVGEENWVFIAATIDASDNVVLYWRFEEDSALSSDTGTFGGTYTPQRIMVGKDSSTSASSQSIDGAVAYVRIFDSALIEADVLSESQSDTAVLTAWADWPMSDTTGDDVSGNARHLTPETDGGSLTVVTDPDITGAGTPNSGLSVFMLNTVLVPEGTGDYSGTSSFGMDLEVDSAGIAPPIPTGTGQFSLGLAVDNLSEVTYVGTTTLSMDLALQGPEPRGPLVTEDVDLPGVMTNLPQRIRVDLWLVDTNRRPVYGIIPSEGYTLVPPHIFSLNLVSSTWSLVLTPNVLIQPAGTTYKRVLWMDNAPVSTDFILVPNTLDDQFFPDLVVT